MKNKEEYFIAHVCLNSKLPKKHPDYCDMGFIDLAPNKFSCSEQCWKYCPHCEAKGYPKITEKPVSEKMNLKIQKMVEVKRNKNGF